MTFALYTAAAFAEIAGCFAFWAMIRQGAPAWWTLPGTLVLVLFALLLTRTEPAFAGRAFAAYGGVYIAASLIWLWLVEKVTPDRTDLLGALLCLSGAAVIVLGHRG